MRIPNPYYRNPDHPNFNRRADHQDYTRPARYLITLMKGAVMPPFSSIPVSDMYLREPKVNLSPLGAVVEEAIGNWQIKYPMLIAEEFAIMPDHVHICVHVFSTLKVGLSRAVSHLMGKISRGYHDSLPSYGRPEKLTPVFAKGFNDRIAYSDEQWLRQINYTEDNPRRYVMKKLHSDYLLKHWEYTVGEKKLILMGNIFLLKQPTLFRVKYSRKFTPKEAEEAFEDWRQRLRNGEIPISPYIHPLEKKLRDFAIAEGYSYIRVCTNGFAERGSAQGREFFLMAEGRLLLIGQEEFKSREEALIYPRASELNQLALEIAEICNSGQGGTIRVLT